jgi:hypothetical protein
VEPRSRPARSRGGGVDLSRARPGHAPRDYVRAAPVRKAAEVPVPVARAAFSYHHRGGLLAPVAGVGGAYASDEEL